MSNLNREDMQVRYLMFQKYGLEDQRIYYQNATEKYRQSATSVNQIRASIALLTGIASAGVGLITAMSLQDCTVSVNCNWWAMIINILIVAATGLPALAAFFNMLADLYQWDKLISIYDSAKDNVEVADAHSPIDSMSDAEYLASLQAYAQGTLDVMSDETAQWGQSIRTPKGMEEYLAEAEERAAELGGSANRHQFGSPEDDASDTTDSTDDIGFTDIQS